MKIGLWSVYSTNRWRILSAGKVSPKEGKNIKSSQVTITSKSRLKFQVRSINMNVSSFKRM